MSAKRIIDSNQSSWLDIPAKITPVSLTLPKTLTYEQWEKIGPKITRLHRFSKWALSDWLNHGERAYGEMYSQAASETGFEPDYLAIVKTVGAAIDPCRRRESLSFTHHRLVASLSPNKQEKFLREAEQRGWSCEQLRQAVMNFKMPSRTIADPIGSEIEPEPDSAAAKNESERATFRPFDTDTVSQRTIDFLNRELQGATADEVAEVLAKIVNSLFRSDTDGFDSSKGVQRASIPYLDGSGQLRYADSVQDAWAKIKSEHRDRRLRQ